MEVIVETMEILANPTAMKAIAANRAGKTKLVPLATLDDERNLIITRRNSWHQH
jgi:hypothetical protein